jgi:hypothetical protein
LKLDNFATNARAGVCLLLLLPCCSAHPASSNWTDIRSHTRYRPLDSPDRENAYHLHNKPTKGGTSRTYAACTSMVLPRLRNCTTTTRVLQPDKQAATIPSQAQLRPTSERCVACIAVRALSLPLRRPLRHSCCWFLARPKARQHQSREPIG